MDLVSGAKNALRVATSQGLALVSRLDTAVRRPLRRSHHRAGLLSRADVRRLAAQIAALDRATDALR